MKSIIIIPVSAIALVAMLISATQSFAAEKKEKTAKTEKTEKTEKTAIERPENQFVTLTFHDVRDDVARSGDRDPYAISTKNLAQFMAWLKKEGWQPIRLEDVWQARMKKKKLPPRAVLLTFDDGALSGYTRVFPLLKQYQFPAVFAIPTSWINGNFKDGYEAYGEGNLMNWDQMREMQQSGLAEFASHSDDMHKGILANPQQNMQPAAITRQYSNQTGQYESDQAYQDRVIADLKKSRQILQQELGIQSRAIFWPYGAVTTGTEDFAGKAGLPMSFSLGSIATLADSVKTYQRVLIMNNPTPEMIREEMMDFLAYARAPYKQRKSFIRMDLAEMESQTTAQFDAKLGQFLDQSSALRSNTMVLKAVRDEDGDGNIDVAYFPNSQLKVRQDILNRMVWQSRTRAHHRVYAELPIRLETRQKIDLAELTADMVRNNPSIEGLMLETDDQLLCAVQQQQWTEACTQQVNHVVHLKERLNQQAKYYSNISNNYQTAFKFGLKGTQLEGLKTLLNYSLKYTDFLYITLDPVQQPETFDALKKQIRQMNMQEVQRLIVSFTIRPDANEAQWKQYQQDYSLLRSLAVQKIGINNYQLKRGSAFHRYLYQDLSLNGSPLTYRDPYQNDTIALEKK
ncbi:poly-beta-1,6-N-acetyl-D-glucosamine N-deacetylase PgaB [Acinetobacter sp. WZC-1]|uniref:poly-beta-1,6-N-acetyl-D-glucosamine N-deacetylase PgaB n=1 Tax=Acinetobacter sp. WZC-1 TaxID=3459034 RepID=UPI00403D6AF1